MRILLINTVYGVGSTGKIVKQIAGKARQDGHDTMIAHRYETADVTYPADAVAVSSWWDCHVHNRLCRLTMLRGCFSVRKTRQFLKKAEAFQPDLIHLHNINGNFINLEMLFRYIRKSKAKVVWTFHDCWPLTGNCKHFDGVQCDKWQSGCGNCPQKGGALLDLSAMMYRRKRKMLAGIENMTIVTPSKWLADLTAQSYLGVYPIRVIHNGIDLSVFRPTGSSFREDNGLEGKKLILGVAFDWGGKKGLDVFVELAARLPEDYRIVLVGTNDAVDAQLPANVICIHRTNNQQELAAIYTAADVFVNPTREDTYPTVNMEALACGTPVVTFRTGGSPEIIDETCGAVVERNDVDELVRQIVTICEKKVYSKEACLKRARQFHMDDRFDEYIQLYEELV